MIRNYTDLMTAILDCTNRMPDGTHEELVAWADADPGVAKVRRLYDIYREAEANPPEGVIGVGIITYAEQKMQEAQQDA